MSSACSIYSTRLCAWTGLKLKMWLFKESQGTLNTRVIFPLLLGLIGLIARSLFNMKVVATLILALVILHVQDCVSQIPRACTDTSSLRNMICCPTADGVCGINAGRGECASLQYSHSTGTTDVRNNWPHYFTMACQCRGNYSGYDCSRLVRLYKIDLLSHGQTRESNR